MFFYLSLTNVILYIHFFILLLFKSDDYEKDRILHERSEFEKYRDINVYKEFNLEKRKSNNTSYHI